MTTAIAIRDLTKRYQQRVVVDRLNLEIAAGSIFGFLGPNGAGKTTRIRMLLGLVRPSAGSATILGYDIGRERAQIAPRVGAIVEVPAFYGYLSGAQNLEVLARLSNVRLTRARIDELIALVGLDGRADDLVRGYSLGMKQRLGIAATLLSNPQILFLDEPTNGLDPMGTIAMRQLIGQLGAAGYTIFLSSHLLSEVEQICQEVCIVQHGVVQRVGQVRELLARRDRYVLEARPVTQALEILRQQPQLQATLRADGLIAITAAEETIPALVQRLTTAQIAIYQLMPQPTTLEEVFLEATRDQ